MMHRRQSESVESPAAAYMSMDVLVAEDEMLVAEEVVGMLKSLGHRVVAQVTTGEAAVEAATRLNPDVVVMDIRMPGPMQGLEAARVIHEKLGVPAVVLSAYADPPLIAEARTSGVYGYVLKPPNATQLAAVLDVAVARCSEYMQKAERVQDLQRQIDERREVEQAKWVLVRNMGMTEPTALKTLQDEARRSQQPLVTVARGVIKLGRIAPTQSPKR